jgi:hypothetical protein
LRRLASLIVAGLALAGTGQAPAQALFETGFEPDQGYAAGDLAGQAGWEVDAGSAEVWPTTVYSGRFSARIAPGGSVSRETPAGTSRVTFRARLQAAPSSAPELPVLGQAAVLYLDPVHGLAGLDGDGRGGGTWVGSGRSVPTGTWFEVEVSLDFAARTWSCSVEGLPVLQGLGFASGDLTAFRSVQLAADTADTLVDEVRIVASIPPPLTDPVPVGPASLGTGFEPDEGYAVGNLDRQNGWAVDSGEAEVWTKTVFSGAQAARIAPGGVVSRAFATGLPRVTYSAYFQARHSTAPDLPLVPQASVVYLDPVRGLTGLDGDGQGGGTWVGSQVLVPEGTWFELTLRLDFDTQRWDCLVDGRPALSGLRFHSDSVVAFGSLEAAANLGDTLIDQARVSAEPPPPPPPPVAGPVTAFPAGLGFEQAEGFLPGDLDSQEGWKVDAGQAEVWNLTAYSGTQAARIAPGGQASRDFATALPILRVRTYLQATASPAPDIPVPAQAAVLYLDPSHGLTGLDGNGAGDGHWVGSGILVPPGQWFELELALDFHRKSWDAWIDGRLALVGLHFHSDDVTAFGTFAAGASSGDTLVDATTLGAEDAVAPTPPDFGSASSSRIGFEPAEGYVPGPLDLQNGWATEAGDALVWSQVVHAGLQSGWIGPSGLVTRDFAVADTLVTVDAYLQATPSSPPAIPEAPRIAVLYLDRTAGITALDGDGIGGGKWVGSLVRIPAGTWFHTRIHMDFATRTWSCEINGRKVFSNLGFHADGIAAFTSLTAGAGPDGPTLLDDLEVTAEGAPVPPPQLAIRVLGADVEISWPTDAAGYRLQITGDLGNPNWTDLATPGSTVVEPVGSGPRFYRLTRP